MKGHPDRGRAAMAVFAAALVLRAAVLLLRPLPPVEADALDYRNLAVNLAEGRGYSHAAEPPYAFAYTRSPLFPFMLAFVYRVFGIGSQAAYWMLALLDAATCALLVLFGAAVTGRRAPGVAAGLFWALHPVALSQTAVLLTETPFGFFLAASLYFGARWRRSRRAADWIVFFVLMALASLCRGSLLLFAPAYAAAHVVCAVRRREVRAAALRALAGVAVYAAVIAPWSVYATKALGSFTIENRGATDALLRGNYDEGTFGHMGNMGHPRHPIAPGQREGLSIDELEKLQSGFARSYMAAHPRVVFRLWLAKFWRLWFNLAYPDPPSLASLAYATLVLVLLVLFVTGMLCLPAEVWGALAPALGVMAYFTAVHVATYAVVRYSVPLTPFLAVPAWVGVEEVVRRAFPAAARQGDGQRAA